MSGGKFGNPKMENAPTVSSPNCTALLVRLAAVKTVMLKFSDVAVRQKRIEEAKKFDLHAIAIDEAIELIKGKVY